MPETGDLITFHCLSTKQKFQVENPEMVKTSHGRYFYVAPSPYATHSKKTGNKLGSMYRAVPKAKLPPGDFLKYPDAGAGAGAASYKKE
jgi:hypothetical protein